jgi:hypothetical protein
VVNVLLYDKHLNKRGLYWGLFFVGLFLFTSTSAQKIIRFSKTKKNHEKSDLYLFPGENVKCKFVKGSKVIGMIAKISENTFEVAGRPFSLDSLRAIGKYRRAAPIILTAGIVAGVAVAASGNAHQLSSAALLGTAELILIFRLSPYSGTIDLQRCKCRLDIIDFSDLPKNFGRKMKINEQ